MNISKHFKRFPVEYVAKIQDNKFFYQTHLRNTSYKPTIPLTDPNVFLLSDWTNLINLKNYGFLSGQKVKLSIILNMEYSKT